ncbi:hypothetical protein NGA_0619500, partial [Nannochloropsis gaditana CCMP526]
MSLGLSQEACGQTKGGYS